jgi:DNA-binding response OmpR family regulator
MCFQITSRLGNEPHKLLALFANDDLRQAVSYCSRALGFTVDTARSGNDAARLLRGSDYRVLVTDRFIPPWPGLDSIPRLKRRYPHVRIVVLLESGPVGIASLLRLAGADVVVEPPLRRAALLAAILPDRCDAETRRSPTGRPFREPY